VVALQQLAQWRTQISGEPSSFTRDLAIILLIELERLQREATDCHQRFAAMQAAVIRAQLATTPPHCRACGDAAVLHVAQRLSVAGTAREAGTTIV
jgi:hypothetical protein